MLLFKNELTSSVDETKFIKKVCDRYGTSPSEIHDKLTADCAAGNFDSEICRGLKSMFSFSCLCSPSVSSGGHNEHFLFTRLFAHLIAGPKGIDEYICSLKNYDYSERCGLVWTGDYFAYRCRTCGLTPSMSLCGNCFNAGNHENHDYHKFKSQAGGACDCGDCTVMSPSGYCRFHGPDKKANRPCPPGELTAALKFLLPCVMKALLYWFWDQCRKEEPTVSEAEAPMLFFLHRLHACGWVGQQLMADVLLDPVMYEELIQECCCTPAYRMHKVSLSGKPSADARGLDDEDSRQGLVHTTLLEAFLYMNIKMRFPEGMSTLLIGLFTISEFKHKFIDAFVDHYGHVASMLMLASRSRNATGDSASILNNRIVHISVQLFSGLDHALRVVTQKKMHVVIAKWLRNMLIASRTRLDDRGNTVVNCESALITYNAFWPMISDLSSLIAHKDVTAILIEDPEFLSIWTDILKYMQFMNSITLKEGNHIEYETTAPFQGLTTEIEVSVTLMWHLWDSLRQTAEKEHCLTYLRACISRLGRLMSSLGHLVPASTQWAHPIRGPMSVHLPLTRHVACFLNLAVFVHKAELRKLLQPLVNSEIPIMRRLLEELANVLLGTQEVFAGYWSRNGTSIRTILSHYFGNHMCSGMVDLDIFLFQVCATLLHPVYTLNSLVDQSRLLTGFCFHRELLALTQPPVDVPDADRKTSAIERWLTLLCWFLDLRNNLGISAKELMTKELVCYLTPAHRKHSDLILLLPDHNGPLNEQVLNECLQEIAEYTAPSINNANGLLQSGQYSLKPEMIKRILDPVFLSLRYYHRADRNLALEKYREDCSRSGGSKLPSLAYWPPFRLPAELPTEFADLENVLHSRHMHYLLFSLLSLYVYGDPLMQEDNLVMVIHLLYRAVIAGRHILTDGLQSHQLKVAEEPNMPQFDPIQCTEAMMNATNRQDEIEAMQFADTDSDDHVEDDDESADELPANAQVECLDDPRQQPDGTVAANTTGEPMEVDEPAIVPVTTESAHPPRGSQELRPFNAFVLRRTQRMPQKWDLSIVACPYPAPQASSAVPTVFDNLATWLATSQRTTTPAVTEKRDNAKGGEYSVPVKNPDCPMVDSLLSLLVKAHTLMSRMKQQSKTNTHDCFMHLPPKDPQCPDAKHERCMAVLTSPGSSDVPASTMVTANATNQEESPLIQALKTDLGGSEGSPEERMLRIITDMPPELRFFAVTSPTYCPSNPAGASTDVPQTSPDGTLFCGDGAAWVARLLDAIVEASPQCKSELEGYLERARDPFSLVQRQLVAEEPEACALPMELTVTDEEKRKRRAELNKQKYMAKHASRAKNFIDGNKECEEIPAYNDEEAECIICRVDIDFNDGVILMSRVAESGHIERMRNYPHLPRLSGERLKNTQRHLMEDVRDAYPVPLLPPEVRNSQSAAALAPEKSPCSGGACHVVETIILTTTNSPTSRLLPRAMPTPPTTPETAGSQPKRNESLAYLEDRRWWELALPVNIAVALPLLRPSMMVQTCGHLVHTLCFRNARSQASVNSNTNLALWASMCPMCRSEVHFMLPVYPDYGSEMFKKQMTSVSVLPCELVPQASMDNSRATGGVASSTHLMSQFAQAFNPSAAGSVATNEEQQQQVGFISIPAGFDPEGWDEPEASKPAERSTAPKTPVQILRERLESLPKLPMTFWNNFLKPVEKVRNSHFYPMVDLMGEYNEANIVLRHQFETEVSVLMAYPDVYRTVARRCIFRDHLNFLRTIYRSPKDLLTLLNSLTQDYTPQCLPKPTVNEEVPMYFAILNDPVDVFLTFLPHVFPDEDQFKALASMCICLAYVRAIVGLVLGQLPDGEPGSFDYSQHTSIHTTQERMKNISSPLKSHVLTVVEHLGQLDERVTAELCSVASQPAPDPAMGESSTGLDLRTTVTASAISSEGGASAAQKTGADRCAGLKPSALAMAASLDVAQLCGEGESPSRDLQRHLVLRVLPTLRVIALALARWRDSSFRRETRLPDIAITMTLPFVGSLVNPEKAECEPPDHVKEFVSLVRFLGWNCGEVSSEQCDDPLLGVGPLLPLVQSSALRSSLTECLNGPRALENLMKRWIGQLTVALTPSSSYAVASNLPATPSSASPTLAAAEAVPALPTPGFLSHARTMRGLQTNATVIVNTMVDSLARFAYAKNSTPRLLDWIQNLGALMEVGRQLYPPRLIRLPRSYDTLFNSLHMVKCASGKHHFQENVLCLVCGQLLCQLCSTSLFQLMFQHSYRCSGSVGVILAINSSSVFVTQGTSSTNWGSVYLDAYGEEDIELRRGRPLFLKEERFALLESQWMSHSFRYMPRAWQNF